MSDLIAAEQAAADAAAAAMLDPQSDSDGQDEAAAAAAAETAKPVKTFTREDLTKARQQEKDKLYPEMQKLREQVQALTATQQAEEEARRKAQEELDAEAKRREEEDMDVRTLLARKEVEWQERLENERLERERAIALLEQERNYAANQQYRNARIEQERENILPELIDLVSGNTPEEIEASINGLRERSMRILESTRDATSQVRRDSVGARVTSPPASDPLDNYSGQKSFTPEQIRAMSVEEYAQYRQALIGNGAAGGGTGMFR